MVQEENKENQTANLEPCLLKDDKPNARESIDVDEQEEPRRISDNLVSDNDSDDDQHEEQEEFEVVRIDDENSEKSDDEVD